jgi:predicted nucleic acid-binding protein
MSPLTLVDTSVWIEFFRKRNPLRLERIVEFDQVVTCLPVIQEVLHCARDYPQLAKVSLLQQRKV